MTLASRNLDFPHVTCHRFAYSYVSRYLVSPHVTRLDSLCHYDVVRTSYPLRHGDVVMTSYPYAYLWTSAIDSRLSRLAGSRYAQSSTRFVYHLSLTRLDVISVSHLYGLCARLYLYVPYLYIYWVGDGTIPIFNLLCNHPKVVACEIPRTLPALL